MTITFKKITRDIAKPFILNKHYAQRMPSISFAYGAYDMDVLVGIVTLGKPASNSLCIGVCGKEYSSKVFELNRLCLIENLPKKKHGFTVNWICFKGFKAFKFDYSKLCRHRNDTYRICIPSN